QHPESVAVRLRPCARIARERHRRIARPVVRAVTRDHPALRLAGRLACEFDRVLVGIAATEGEEHTASLESRALEEEGGELRARLGAPGVGDEAQLLRLGADRGDDMRMLMPEVA